MASACGVFGSISSSASRAGPSAFGSRPGAARGIQRAGGVAGRQAHAAHGGPGRRAGGRVGQIVGQRLFHHAGGQLLVGGPRIVARDAPIMAMRRSRGVGQGDLALERLHGFGQAVQADQDLQHITVGLARIRAGLASRRAPPAAPSRPSGTAARSPRRAGTAWRRWSCAPHPGSANSRRPARRRGVEFAQQQLVEQLAVQRRSGRPPSADAGRRCGLGVGHRQRCEAASAQGSEREAGQRIIEP